MLDLVLDRSAWVSEERSWRLPALGGEAGAGPGLARRRPKAMAGALVLQARKRPLSSSLPCVCL
jgi:hypothetical protein